MKRRQREFSGSTDRTDGFNMELERRRVVLLQIEDALRSATRREEITEQLRRISEQSKFVQQLSGRSSSLQTAASVLNFIQETSRLNNLATRKLAAFEQGPGTALPLGAQARRRPSPPAT